MTSWGWKLHPTVHSSEREDFNFDPLGLSVKCEKFLPWFREVDGVTGFAQLPSSFGGFVVRLVVHSKVSHLSPGKILSHLVDSCEIPGWLLATKL